MRLTVFLGEPKSLWKVLIKERRKRADSHSLMMAAKKGISRILWNSLAFMEITQFIWKMKLTLCRCRYEGAKSRTKPICFTRAISHFRIKNSKIVMFVWWCAHCKYVLHLLKASFLQLGWKCDAIPQNDQSTMCKTWTLKMFALNNSL